MNKAYFVYIMASRMGGTLYVGFTGDLPGRVWQHKNHLIDGFTAQHDITLLVYYELHDSPDAGITREKQIKQWQRAWKIRLIEQSNPYWFDLYEDLFG